ncbi:hypothetical protein ACFL0Y_02915 [Patescibacteria group bacterium]
MPERKVGKYSVGAGMDPSPGKRRAKRESLRTKIREKLKKRKEERASVPETIFKKGLTDLREMGLELASHCSLPEPNTTEKIPFKGLRRKLKGQAQKRTKLGIKERRAHPDQDKHLLEEASHWWAQRLVRSGLTNDDLKEVLDSDHPESKIPKLGKEGPDWETDLAKNFRKHLEATLCLTPAQLEIEKSYDSLGRHKGYLSNRTKGLLMDPGLVEQKLRQVISGDDSHSSTSKARIRSRSLTELLAIMSPLTLNDLLLMAPQASIVDKITKDLDRTVQAVGIYPEELGLSIPIMMEGDVHLFKTRFEARKSDHLLASSEKPWPVPDELAEPIINLATSQEETWLDQFRQATLLGISPETAIIYETSVPTILNKTFIIRLAEQTVQDIKDGQVSASGAKQGLLILAAMTKRLESQDYQNLSENEPFPGWEKNHQETKEVTHKALSKSIAKALTHCFEGGLVILDKDMQDKPSQENQKVPSVLGKNPWEPPDHNEVDKVALGCLKLTLDHLSQNEQKSILTALDKRQVVEKKDSETHEPNEQVVKALLFLAENSTYPEVQEEADEMVAKMVFYQYKKATVDHPAPLQQQMVRAVAQTTAKQVTNGANNGAEAGTEGFGLLQLETNTPTSSDEALNQIARHKGALQRIALEFEKTTRAVPITDRIIFKVSRLAYSRTTSGSRAQSLMLATFAETLHDNMPTIEIPDKEGNLFDPLGQQISLLYAHSGGEQYQQSLVGFVVNYFQQKGKETKVKKDQDSTKQKTGAEKDEGETINGAVTVYKNKN